MTRLSAARFNMQQRIKESQRASGHRFQAVDPRPYIRMGTKPPVTCAYCGKLGGDPSHNTSR